MLNLYTLIVLFQTVKFHLNRVSEATRVTMLFNNTGRQPQPFFPPPQQAYPSAQSQTHSPPQQQTHPSAKPQSAPQPSPSPPQQQINPSPQGRTHPTPQQQSSSGSANHLTSSGNQNSKNVSHQQPPKLSPPQPVPQPQQSVAKQTPVQPSLRKESDCTLSSDL